MEDSALGELLAALDADPAPLDEPGKKASSSRKRKRPEDVATALEAYTAAAVELAEGGQGQGSVEIAKVVKAAMRWCPWDMSLSNSLLKSLVPSEPVSQEVVKLLLGQFAALPQTTQVLVLKFLVLTWERMTPGAQACLRSLYGLVFHALEYSKLRPLAARLLHAITIRRHALPYRARRVRELMEQTGVESRESAGLFLVLRVFATYCDSVTVPHTRARNGAASILTQSVDKEWESRMEGVWGRREQGDASDSERTMASQARETGTGGGGEGGRAPLPAFKLRPQLQTSSSSSSAGMEKRKPQQRGQEPLLSVGGPGPLLSVGGQEVNLRSSAVPARDSLVGQGHLEITVVTLEEVGSVEQLLEALVKPNIALRLPDRSVSLLSDTIYQHLLLLQPRSLHLARVQEALPQLLDTEFAFPSSGNGLDAVAAGERRQRLLEMLVRLTDMTQELPVEVEAFVLGLLKVWDGHSHLEELLSLVAMLRPCPFDALYEGVLAPLNHLFQAAPAPTKAAIGLCLTSLLRNWCRLDWKRHFSSDAEADRRGLGEGQADRGSQGPFLFGTLQGGVDHFRTIFEFITFVDQMMVASLVRERDHMLVQTAALDFFDQVAVLNTAHALPFLVPPSPTLVYRLLLSSNAMAQSRGAGLLFAYKAAFERIKRRASPGRHVPPLNTGSANHDLSELSFRSGLDRISLFNSFVWDFSNTLWRNVPLTHDIPQHPGQARAQSVLFDLPQDLLDQLKRIPRLQTAFAFSLTGSVAFASLAAEFLQEKGFPEGTSPRSIKGRLRVEYLGFLRQRGMSGLEEFLYTFISSLLERRVAEKEDNTATTSTSDDKDGARTTPSAGGDMSSRR